MRLQRDAGRSGLTLTEMLVVLVILVALAALLVPLVGTSSSDARERVTTENMTALRNVILGNFRNDMKEDMLTPYRGMTGVRPPVLPRPGYYGVNSGGRPDTPQLRYLFVNPGPCVAPGSPESTTQTYRPDCCRGWRGPYFLQEVGKYKVDVIRGFTTDFGQDGDPA